MNTLLISFLLLLSVSTAGLANAEVHSTWRLNQGEVIVDTQVAVDLTSNFTLLSGVEFSGIMEVNEFQSKASTFALMYATDRFALWGGLRDYNVGKARFNSVFLGDNSAAFPSIGYKFKGEKFTYQKIYGDLSVTDDYKRVGIHYMEFHPAPWLTVGLGEAMVTQEPFDFDFLYDVVPLLPYYLSKYLPGIHSRPNNSSFYGDFELSFTHLDLYGEFVVSEFPITPTATNPDLWGLTIGAETQLIPNWTTIVEFSRVQNYAYANNSLLDTSFAVGTQPLGHPHGDDLEVVDLQLRRAWNSNLATNVGFFYRAWGDNGITEWYTSHEQYKETRFLGGIPEKLLGTKFGVTYGLTPTLTIDFQAEIGRASNFRHQQDRIGYRHSAVVALHWQLP